MQQWTLCNQGGSTGNPEVIAGSVSGDERARRKRLIIATSRLHKLHRSGELQQNNLSCKLGGTWIFEEAGMEILYSPHSQYTSRGWACRNTRFYRMIVIRRERASQETTSRKGEQHTYVSRG